MLDQQIDLRLPCATTSTQQASLIPFSTHKAEVVQFPLRSIELCTSWQPTPLFNCASSLLRQTMNERGLKPTQDHLDGLLAVLKVLCQMAEGSCPSSIHLSSLDPGMGKTTTVVCFLKALRHCPGYEDVGVVVFVSRLDEIRKLVDEVGLTEDDFAVLTADDDCNQLSSTPVDQAQVLFTTQQMLSKRGAGRSFSSLQDLYYMGKARAVRVWDETIDPAAVTCPSARDLMAGLKPLETVSAKAADDLDQFIDKLKKTDVGRVLRFPSFVFPDLERAKKQFPEASGVMDALRSLSGSYVRVLKSHRNTEMALHIRDALPIDISPMLVLDASGSVRQTYCAWSAYRGGLIHLLSVRKNYSPLTVHFMKRGGGKDSWRQSSHELAREVADVINRRPDEKFLVVHHRCEASFNPKLEILRLVEGDKTRVQFIHWGQHQATNAYREIPNVVLAGVLHLPDSQHTGLAYASTGYPLTEDLPDGLTDKIRLGELGHAILQAAGRGVMRGFEDGSCPPCNLYIIAAAQSGIEGELPKLFPGCSTRSWKRRHKNPKGKVKAALEYIQQQRQLNPFAPVTFEDVMAHLGISDRSNFNRTIRKHPDFKKGLEKMAMIEDVVGTGRHPNAFLAFFPPVETEEASGMF